jgi:acylphosphatase
MRAALRAIVHGRVQGVSFRYHTVRFAAPLGIVGFVRNLPDRTVEVVAEGDRTALEELAAWLGHGPDFARVSAVDFEWSSPVGRATSFEIRY